MDPQIRLERVVPGALRAVEVTWDGLVALEVDTADGRISLEDLKWLCVVAGPALLAVGRPLPRED